MSMTTAEAAKVGVGRRLAMFLGSLAALAAVAYAILLAALAFGQGAFMYPAPKGGHLPALPGWREIALRTPAGIMTAYHLPARAGMPTVVFLHGNGTGYAGSVVATAGSAAKGVGVLIPEYPGFGGNPGSPSEKTIGDTAEAAYVWLRRSVPADRIVIYGNSIGSGPAVRIARMPHAELILVSPVASMVDVVQDHYPIAPGFLVRDRYENEKALGTVEGPVLVVHAQDDAVVPHSHGVRMAKASGARFVDLPTGGHGIAFDRRVSDLVASEITNTPTR